MCTAHQKRWLHWGISHGRGSWLWNKTKGSYAIRPIGLLSKGYAESIHCNTGLPVFPYLREDDYGSTSIAGSFFINPTLFISVQHLLLYEPTKDIFLPPELTGAHYSSHLSSRRMVFNCFFASGRGLVRDDGCCCQSSLWSFHSCYSSCTGSFKSLHKQFATNCSAESLGFCMQYFGRIRSA